jgi:valyl-tRNA synthetase
MYHYIWHTLADKIIEAEKENLSNGTDARKSESYELLEHLLSESLKLLHPFMPFVTEAIWERLPDRRGLLMIERW